jgi:hypothetical protein
MNPKIKELADKAQEYAEWMTPQGLEWLDNFKEQFAKLIIEECANIALREDHDPYECILKHFGVTNAIQTD